MQTDTAAGIGPEGELACRIAAAAPRIDAAAEADLYRRLAPRVRLYGRRHLRDDDQAQDLAQHVMIMAIEKLRSGALREPERIVSFVFGACRMVTLEMRRGEHRHERLLELYGAELEIADISVPVRLDERRVARCLEHLSERERTVMIMSFYDDEPAERVAAMLSLTEVNVRVIRHRALQRLRDCVLGREKP
jgi:RNA polymerase sigma-70 factor (ECF subfamily)